MCEQRRSPRSIGRGERGQALPLVLVFLWVAVGAAVLAVHTANRAAERARAQTAADAAALAGAVEPHMAGPVAERNGFTVTGSVTTGPSIEVTVAGPSASARAAATAPLGAVDGLTTQMMQSLAAAERLLGTPVPVVSGFRSRAQQQALWDNRHNNPYPVARPGTSDHERGMAVDVSLTFVPRLKSVIAVVGLCQPLPTTDPVHFVVCANRRTP